MCCTARNGFKSILIISIISLILCVIAAVFARSAKTERYTQALKYLKAISDGNLDINTFGFYDCQKLGYYRKDKYYCDKDGKKYNKPSDSVIFKNIFKNWNKIEFALHISRAALTLLIFVFTFFAFKQDTDIMYKLLLIFTIFLLLISFVCILMRGFVIEANEDIGLDEDGKLDSFEDTMVGNMMMDFILIMLNIGEICIIKNGSCGDNYSSTATPSPSPTKAIVAIVEKRVVVGEINSDGHPLDNFS
jgi:hypothetical protein